MSATLVRILKSPIAKIILGLCCFVIAIWIPTKCVNPEDAVLFNEFPYFAIKLLALIDFISIFLMLILIERVRNKANGWQQRQEFIHIFFIAALTQLVLLLSLRIFSSVTMQEYQTKRDSSIYACEFLPVSIVGTLQSYGRRNREE